MCPIGVRNPAGLCVRSTSHIRFTAPPQLLHLSEQHYPLIAGPQQATRAEPDHDWPWRTRLKMQDSAISSSPLFSHEDKHKVALAMCNQWVNLMKARPCRGAGWDVVGVWVGALMSGIIQRKVVWHAALLLQAGGMKANKPHCFHLAMMGSPPPFTEPVPSTRFTQRSQWLFRPPKQLLGFLLTLLLVLFYVQMMWS